MHSVALQTVIVQPTAAHFGKFGVNAASPVPTETRGRLSSSHWRCYTERIRKRDLILSCSSAYGHARHDRRHKIADRHTACRAAATGHQAKDRQQFASLCWTRSLQTGFYSSLAGNHTPTGPQRTHIQSAQSSKLSVALSLNCTSPWELCTICKS